jgi:ABC-2 type transport system permease protein
MTRTLLKVFLKENFSFRRLLGFDAKKSKAKAVLITLAMVYALAVFVGLFGYMFFDLGETLKAMGQMRLLLSFSVIYAIGLSMMIVLFRADGTLFHTKDHEILAPLPLSWNTVLAARMAVLWIMVVAMGFLATSPILFSYLWHGGVNVLSIMFYLVGFLVLPLVPIILMSFISLLIARVSRKMRHANIVRIILLFLVFALLMAGSFSINDPEVNPLTGQIDLFKGISDVYLPFSWFMDAVHEQSVTDFALLVVSHIGLFALYLFGVSKITYRTNQESRSVVTRQSGKAFEYKEKSVTRTLVGKELNTFLSIPIYALNAGLGAVILLILSVASLFYTEGIAQLMGTMVAEGLDITSLVLILVGFCIVMTYTPAVSLSLEGKRFWIVKSLPIPARTLVFSKVLFNMALIAPVAALSVILFGISFGFSVLTQMLMIALVVVFTGLISYFDAAINLWMPKFDFVNPVEVIKQSAGALIAIFGGFAWLAASGVVWYFLQPTFSADLILLVLITMNALFAFGFVLLVNTKAEPMIRAMKA